MTRPMTPVEQARFHGYFPNLDVAAAQVSGPATPVYNCIAWTLGITTQWIWPGNNIGDFDPYYNRIGYRRTTDTNSPIAVWGYTFSQMTHGSISGLGHGPRWESKCGADLRIQHGRDELGGPNPAYGRILAYYKPDRALLAGAETLLTLPADMTTISAITPEQLEFLKESTAGINPGLREAFASNFAKWKATWFAGNLSVNSDPHARASGAEFEALVRLGPETLPLVIEALADPENFMALQLYNAIQPEPDLLAHIEADDPRIMEGEQGKARMVVQRYVRDL